MFDHGVREIDWYHGIVHYAKSVSIECFKSIVYHLLKAYGYDFDLFDPDIHLEGTSEVLYAIRDRTKGTILLFKEIERDVLWKLRDREPEQIEQFLKKEGFVSCKYVYLMLDRAYLQIVGHNDDKDDPGRGYNLYSVKWLFETYFGDAEFACFNECLADYEAEVRECLGFIQVKALTPNALVNFRIIVENRLLGFNYRSTLSEITNEYGDAFNMDERDYPLMRQQFIDEKYYQVLVSNRDFADSLVTAEWLYESMAKAGAIDLTVIGLGYFKAVEQLLYDLICLHKNEGRRIKRIKSSELIELSDQSIDDDIIDSTLGSMANFYKSNLRILRNAISYKTKTYIKEALFDYARLRNGYFHKANIHDISRVDGIRDASLRIIFLLLGAQSLDHESRSSLGMYDTPIANDNQRLYEYVNYHAGEFFLVAYDDGEEHLGYATPDPEARLTEGRYIEYSGMYLRQLGPESRVFKLDGETIPDRVWLARLNFARTELMNMDIEKVALIFEDGKFVGQSLVEEGLEGF